jgi:hypothetical protein
MIPFELAEPPSLEAAIGLLNPHNPTIRPMAGGTALMLMMKAGVFHLVKLISLRTPGRFSAARVSTDLILPCGTVLRNSLACSIPGSRIVCVYSARPVTLSRPSTRSTDRPICDPTLTLGSMIAAIEDRSGIKGSAFIEASAFQCGYCTPGFVIMVTKLLDEHPDPDDETITHYLSSNLCRCAAYPEVLEAVKLAARKRRTVGGKGLG